MADSVPTVFRIRGDLACLIGLVITIVTSIFAFDFKVTDSLTAALEGAMMGFWPIVYIIVAAVFTYNLTTASGGMSVIKQLLTSISNDRRILVLILAYGDLEDFLKPLQALVQQLPFRLVF